MKKENLKVDLKVTYIPKHARQDEAHPARQLGIVKSWNDSFVFVDYGSGQNIATRLEDLEVGEHTLFNNNLNKEFIVELGI